MSFNFSDITDSFSGAVKSASELASSIYGARFAVQSQALQLQGQRLAIDVARTNAQTNADIAKLQAAAQLRQAQASYNMSGIDFSNLSALVSRGGSGNNIMLILTVLGVGVAVLSYVKHR